MRFPMEMHMVCINSKYIESNGTLNDEYLTAEDGVAVLGFMFSIGKKVFIYICVCLHTKITPTQNIVAY